MQNAAGGTAGAANASEPDSDQKPAVGPSQPPSQPRIHPWLKKLTDFAVKMANHSKLSKLLVSRQAAYLNKMMDWFEQGNTMEALRHAIPLSDGDESDGQTLLGTPQARANLRISAPGGVGNYLHLHDDLRELMRKTYRNTFERLALDTLQPQLASVWQIADLPGEIIAFDDDGMQQTLLITDRDSLQQWRYMLPARRLNQRDHLPLPDSDIWQLLHCAGRAKPLKLYLMEEQNQLRRVMAAGSYVAFQLITRLVWPWLAKPRKWRALTSSWRWVKSARQVNRPRHPAWHCVTTLGTR